MQPRSEPTVLHAPLSEPVQETPPMLSIVASVAGYEAWMRDQLGPEFVCPPSAP